MRCIFADSAAAASRAMEFFARSWQIIKIRSVDESALTRFKASKTAKRKPSNFALA